MRPDNLRIEIIAKIIEEMANVSNSSGPSQFSKLARWAARVAGHPGAFFLALLVIVLWAASGPYFHFSDTWQLVINTGTTIVTFLMVFLIQNSQNRDTIAMQVKLDELVRAVHAAQNSVLNLEDLDEDELETLLVKYQKLGAEARARALQKRNPVQ
jgi:low affinity Fe/Cu permease